MCSSRRSDRRGQVVVVVSSSHRPHHHPHQARRSSRLSSVNNLACFFVLLVFVHLARFLLRLVGRQRRQRRRRFVSRRRGLGLVRSFGQNLHFLLARFELLFKFFGNVGVSKLDRKGRFHQCLAVRKVGTGPAPRFVRSDVGHQDNAGMQEKIRNDFQDLFLAHEHPNDARFAVAEQAGLADAALLPGFLARAHVQQGFSENEQFGAVRVQDFLEICV